MSEEIVAELEDFNVDEPVKRTQVVPATEYVKRNILYSWFKIEAEYEHYVFLTLQNKQPKVERLTSRIMTIYQTILRSVIIKMKIKDYDEFIMEMDKYVNSDFSLPQNKISLIIQKLSDFLCASGLTNIAYDIKPWQQEFEESYPA